MIGRRTILKKLEAVIFDFDGTIVDTEKVYLENMRDLTSEMLGKTLDKMDRELMKKQVEDIIINDLVCQTMIMISLKRKLLDVL